MLKPGYFVENQGGQGNCHESLLPAMSTLVIIAHVKDGADLARKHNLPNSIMDFIQQHHGTTLVEYFYRRASQQRESDPDGGDVDEGSYRYPGPKPQTREAAVLMLADAAESASRTLVDPGPSRIESLRPRHRDETPARRSVRRVWLDAEGIEDCAGQPHQVAHRRLPRSD